MKKILALIMSLLLVAGMAPMVFSAPAAASVVNINGERTAFVNAFGKATYDGTSYTAYKKFQDAFSAIGTQGGRILVSGILNIDNFSDIPGRNTVKIIGIGASSSDTQLYFKSKVTEINLSGNLVMDNISVRFEKAAAPIITNGYALELGESVMPYGYISGKEGEYIYPFNLDVLANVPDGKDGKKVSIEGGMYTTIIAGSGGTQNSVSSVTVSGGKTENLYAGSAAGTIFCNTKVSVLGGEIKNLYAGSLSETKISGGNVENVILGGNSGTAVLDIYPEANINDVKTSAGSGDLMVVLHNGADAKIPAGIDYQIKISGGNVKPVISNGAISGFELTDNYGSTGAEVYINGKLAEKNNGIYTLSKGTSEIEVKTKLSVSFNDKAVFVQGYTDGTFLPQNNMSRAEAITLLTRLIADENEVKGKIAANYSDVADDAWYNSYIGFFQNLGYLTEIEDDFGTLILPTNKITRAEFVQLIYNMKKNSLSGVAKLSALTDVLGHKNANAINYAVSQGYVMGYTDGTFKPENNITRAEVVTIVNRIIGRVPTNSQGQTNFSDISSHWAKGQIIAACGEEGSAWTKAEVNTAKYNLSGTTAKDYITGLYNQSKDLSGDAVVEGINTVSEKMKSDIKNTSDRAPSDYKGQVYYISEKNGNDNNDGKSPATAWKTTQKANTLAFTTEDNAILFERGGIYRGTVKTLANTTYGAYGSGEKPVIMQSSRNYADESLWKETDVKNVYKCSLELYNVGIMVFDRDVHNYGDYNATIGTICNKYAFGFETYADLDSDLEFYSDLTTKELYLYSDKGNPGKRFSDIEIGERINIFAGSAINVTIDNLAVMYTGAHGIGSGSMQNYTVKNSIFCWIGGSVLSHDEYRKDVVNYGNAIECYGQCDGFYVDNCWIYQIYDTAITFQNYRDELCIEKNIKFTNNLLEKCYWNIEIYNSRSAAGIRTEITDVYIAYNVLNDGGYGWGSAMKNRLGLSYSQLKVPKTNKDMLSEYNIINRCSGDILRLDDADNNEVERNNIYVQDYGKSIGVLKGQTVDFCDYSAGCYISQYLKDTTSLMIVKK